MVLFPALLVVVLSSAPNPIVSQVPCQTIADCWLDEQGTAIPRPKRLKARALPRGDCGRNLHWLRHKLSCEANLCTVRYIGDKC